MAMVRNPDLICRIPELQVVCLLERKKRSTGITAAHAASEFAITPLIGLYVTGLYARRFNRRHDSSEYSALPFSIRLPPTFAGGGSNALVYRIPQLGSHLLRQFQPLFSPPPDTRSPDKLYIGVFRIDTTKGRCT
jgi:hypothetical protein